MWAAHRAQRNRARVAFKSYPKKSQADLRSDVAVRWLQEGGSELLPESSSASASPNRSRVWPSGDPAG